MWEELVEILDRAVNVAVDGRLKIDLYKRLGRVWSDKLGRERNSLDAWLCAYELDPNDLQTLNALASLYRATQSWEELSQTLQRIIDVGQVGGEGVGELRRVGIEADAEQGIGLPPAVAEFVDEAHGVCSSCPRRRASSVFPATIAKTLDTPTRGW